MKGDVTAIIAAQAIVGLWMFLSTTFTVQGHALWTVIVGLE